jgi:hypothetical protein
MLILQHVPNLYSMEYTAFCRHKRCEPVSRLVQYKCLRLTSITVLYCTLKIYALGPVPLTMLETSLEILLQDAAQHYL